MPASTGLGEPRQGTHLSMLRTTHPRTPEGAPVLPIYGEVSAEPTEGLVGPLQSSGRAAGQGLMK